MQTAHHARTPPLSNSGERAPIDDAPTPWWAYAILLDPTRVRESLVRLRDVGLIDAVPTHWQIAQGIVRMWHRVIFRSDTVGMSTSAPVRRTWRARLLASRPLRFPFLLAERAVAPLDFSGLVSPPDRIASHLLGAHHDGVQFAYDLQLLFAHPGWLERVRDRARAVVDGSDPRGPWLRDLVVYERYHERLLAAVEGAVRGDFGLDRVQNVNPDVSLVGYLLWCLAQPRTPAETWTKLSRRGARTAAN